MRPREQLERNNRKIWLALLFLCVYGLILIFSTTAASCGASASYGYDAWYYVRRQVLMMAAGWFVMLLVSRVSYRALMVFAVPIYLSGIAFILFLKTSLAVSANGATRWLRFGSFQFQVSAWVMICCIIMFAFLVQFYGRKLKKPWVTLLIWGTGAIPAGLLFVISNDLSSALVVAGTCFCVTLICCRTWKMHIFGALGVLGAGGAWVYSIWRDMPTAAELENMSFRVARIAAWLDPNRYSSGQGLQTLQGLYAIGRGGIFGCGLGSSLQKYNVPESHTDFIFTILCEELGLVGAAILIILFIYLLYQLMRIVLSAKELFGSTLVLGVFFHIAIQTIVNIGVCTGMLPNTGLPLPFISYGGSSVFCLLAGEMAMVLSVEWYLAKGELQRREENPEGTGREPGAPGRDAKTQRGFHVVKRR